MIPKGGVCCGIARRGFLTMPTSPEQGADFRLKSFGYAGEASGSKKAVGAGFFWVLMWQKKTRFPNMTIFSPKQSWSSVKVQENSGKIHRAPLPVCGLRKIVGAKNRMVGIMRSIWALIASLIRRATLLRTSCMKHNARGFVVQQPFYSNSTITLQPVSIHVHI